MAPLITCHTSRGRSILLELSLIVLVVLCSSSVVGLSVERVASEDEIRLPTNIDELFGDVFNNNSVSRMLKEREHRFANKTIKEVASGMFMAYNYAMGNSLWIVTPHNSIIVVDCPESVEVASVIREDMRRLPAIGNKPISFIIYTMYHGDHTFGARAFVDDPANGDQEPTIIAHKNLIQEAEFFDTYRFIKLNRVTRVFGSLLPKSVKINAWVPLNLGKVKHLEFWPTALLDLENAGDKQDMILDGIPVQFVFIPGYTTDQIAVWFPTTRLMAVGDTFYSMFPNIYTIRGEPARDALAWSKTVRIVRSYNAEVLYPQHFDPIYGREFIADVLENVADSMQFIHDQTVRLLAKGHTPDIVSRMIKLPTSLEDDANIPQVYGSIEANSKAVADRYIGWFNGEAEDLLPVSKDEFASKMVRDFGRDVVMSRAIEAYKAGDHRWALTLASYVWRAENRSLNDALYWRTQALKRLAENFKGVQLRQYLYSSALIDWGFVDENILEMTFIQSRPMFSKLHTIENCFELMALHVDAERAAGVDQTIDLSLTDDPNLRKDEVYRMRLRNSVLYVSKELAVDPLQRQSGSSTLPCVRSDQHTWRQILSGQLTIDMALFSNAMRIVRNGGVDIRAFMDNFDFRDQL